MDFVTWVVVVFVVFLLPLFLFWSAESRKWGVGHASCQHEDLKGIEV